MSKPTFLGVIAVLPFIATGAMAAKPTVLWKQKPASEGVVFSDNAGSDQSAGADDFAVPSGQTWLVGEVDVTGKYFDGPGFASSEVVTFYTDKKGKPGRVHGESFTLNCADNAGVFQCKLPKRVKLKEGTWWVSLVANCDFATCGEWGWRTSATVGGHEAVFEDPTGSGACTTWEPLDTCFGGSPADLAFALRGRVLDSN